MHEAFLLLAITGSVEAVWIMAILSHRQPTSGEYPALRQARRMSLGGVALAFLWGAHFTVRTSWEPLMPCVVAVGFVDAYLALTIVSAYCPRRPAADGSREAFEGVQRRRGMAA